MLGTAVGNSVYLPNAKQLMGLTGIFVGFGDIVGAICVSLVSKYGILGQNNTFANLKQRILLKKSS